MTVSILNDLVPSGVGELPMSAAYWYAAQKNTIRGFYAGMDAGKKIQWMLWREVYGRVIDQVRVLEVRRLPNDTRNKFSDIFVVVRMNSLDAADKEVVVISQRMANYYINSSFLTLSTALKAIENMRDMGVILGSQVRIDLQPKAVKLQKPVKSIVDKKRLAFNELDAAGKQYLGLQRLFSYSYFEDPIVAADMVHVQAWKDRAAQRVTAAVALAATVGH